MIEEQNMLYKEAMANGVDPSLMLTEDDDQKIIWDQHPFLMCGLADESWSTQDIKNTNMVMIKNNLERFLPLNKLYTMVDIGAGFEPVSELVKGNCEYIPMDIIPWTPRTKYIEGDGSIPMEDESTDIVVFHNMFQHLLDEQRKKYISEAMRVLVTGGTIYINAPHQDTMFKLYNLPKHRNNGRRCLLTGLKFTYVPNIKDYAIPRIQYLYVGCLNGKTTDVLLMKGPERNVSG